MKVRDLAAQKLIKEFTKSRIVVEFSNDLIHEVKTIFQEYEDSDANQVAGSESKREPISIDTVFRPFSVKINDEFVSPMENSSTPDPKYYPYVESLRDNVIAEIEQNINLRIGKWDILNYLTNLEFELKEIRNNFHLSEFTETSAAGTKVIRPDHPFKIGEFPLYENSNITIEIIPEIFKHRCFDHYEDLYMDSTLARYWDIQIFVIERLLRFIEPRKKVIEITDDYVKVIDIFPSQSVLHWEKSDTDFLELITALLETKSISNDKRNLSRKDAIEVLSVIFNKEIKDPESKLSRATNRKKDISPYLSSLKGAFDNYAIKKEDKLNDI